MRPVIGLLAVIFLLVPIKSEATFSDSDTFLESRMCSYWGASFHSCCSAGRSLR